MTSGGGQPPSLKAIVHTIWAKDAANRDVAAISAAPSVRAARLGSWTLRIGSCLLALCALPGASESPSAQGGSGARTITWTDVAPLHARLEKAGITSSTFAEYVDRTRRENARRVREGDLDHLIFYLLQSTRFTKAAPIEPALSAKSLVDSLGIEERKAFLGGTRVAAAKIPGAVKARLAAFLDSIRGTTQNDDPRLRYFRTLVSTVVAGSGDRETRLLDEYQRTMRFVYEKEFVAQRSARAADAIAGLYRARGLSTDTAIEAGFLVHSGLGIAKSLDPERLVRRVLIVGPGLDLAPRTALLDARPPESYQPWAVIDALVTLKLSRAEALEVVAADINPRVVDHLSRARTAPPTLTLVSEIRDSETVTLSEDYRSYFAQLGRGIGRPRADVPVEMTAGHLSKRITVDGAIANVLAAVSLDIVTERLDGPPFDVVIATNILPYFDDRQLILAMSNIAAMVAPRGVFLHNEARPVLGELAETLGLSFEQSRHAVIATVRGATTPLFDSVWLHRKLGVQGAGSKVQRSRFAARFSAP